MGTRCWRGWRPGGAGLAVIGQGSQAHHSLPSRCKGVSHYWQCIEAHVTAWDSVRTKEMVREAARAVESATTPKLAKDSPATGEFDGRGSLGQADGAQGALSRPEWLRGCEQT